MIALPTGIQIATDPIVPSGASATHTSQSTKADSTSASISSRSTAGSF